MMDFAFQFEQQQTQKLAMTTQMQTALRILEMSSDELTSYIAQQATENVFMQPPTAGRSRTAGARQPARSTPAMDAVWAKIPAAEEGLVDAVRQQIRLSPIPSDIQARATLLAGYLDENGFLDLSPDEARQTLSLTAQAYEEAVHIIQSCDPAGIGARSLQECLLLQIPLLPADVQTPARRILQDGYDDLLHGRMARLARKLHLEDGEVQRTLQHLAKLSLRPGYRGQEATALMPDLVVQRVGTDYVVTLARRVGEVCRVHDAYAHLMRDRGTSDARDYLKDQWQSARWIERCVAQRGMTLQRIGEALVERQRDFLDEGPKALHPMTLRDVATAIGVHESTVSRAIRNKYMSTPHGVMELRSLFSAALDRGFGQTSAAAIREEMRNWIQQEDPSNPLTDAQIADRFRREGSTVSRRTIAKYREALGIPGARLRKRH